MGKERAAIRSEASGSPMRNRQERQSGLREKMLTRSLSPWSLG